MSESPTQVGGGRLRPGPPYRPEADVGAGSAAKRRRALESPADPAPREKRRQPRGPPPALEASHHLARPLLSGPCGALRFSDEWLRSEHRMSVAEERIAVGDPRIGAALDAQDGLAAPHVLEREAQPVDLELRAARDELLCLL